MNFFCIEYFVIFNNRLLNVFVCGYEIIINVDTKLLSMWIDNNFLRITFTVKFSTCPRTWERDGHENEMKICIKLFIVK